MNTQEEQGRFSIFTKTEGGVQTVVKKEKIDKIAINALVELLVAIIEKKNKSK